MRRVTGAVVRTDLVSRIVGMPVTINVSAIRLAISMGKAKQRVMKSEVQMESNADEM